MIRLSHVLLVVGILALLSTFLFPVYTSCGVQSPATRCLLRVKEQSLGLILYAGDADDRLPLRDMWMDATVPYVKNRDVLHCPSVPKGVYGYAFNGALSGAKTPAKPDEVPMMYDSANPIRNASDLVTSLPSPGRHGTEERHGNTVGYADGHAKRVIAP